MAEFTKVVVHFTTADGQPRSVVIPANGPVTEILLDRKVPPNRPIPPKLASMIQGGLVEDGDGPLVCYMLDGVRVCW